MNSATLLESVGVVLGIAGVWLSIRQNVWCWPIGLANVSLFAWVFFRARLYGSASLQVVYFVLSIYGWYAWAKRDRDGHTLTVTRAPRATAAALVAAAAVCAIGFGVFLRDRTDASLPFIDAGATSFSLVGQIMATRKWIENWAIWIAVDLVYVGMYLSQGLYPTTALYAGFLVLAVLGFREWRASMTAPAAA